MKNNHDDIQINNETLPRYYTTPNFLRNLVCIVLVVALMASFTVIGFTLSYQTTVKTTATFKKPDLSYTVTHDTSSNKVTINNTGNIPIYVRVFFDLRMQSGSNPFWSYAYNSSITKKSGDFTLKDDGFYLYNPALQPGASCVLEYNKTVTTTNGVGQSAFNIYTEAVQAVPNTNARVYWFGY